MRLTFFILLVAALQVVGETSYGQEVSLNKRDITLLEMLKTVRKQTGYLFICDLKMLEGAFNVNVNVSKAPLKEVLDACFVNQPVTYNIVDKTIVVQKRKPEVHKTGEADKTRPLNYLTPSPDAGEKKMEVNQEKIRETSAPAIMVIGKVTDEKAEGLPGVSILIKGTQRGTVTDVKGEFKLEVADTESVLVFSFVGYTSQEIAVGNKTSIEIVLNVDNKALEEVVVVGYGVQKKKTLTGSVAVVDGAEIVKAPVMNVSNSLSGRMAGVTAVTRSGEPGNDGTTIRIRGSNTLGNSGALVVIDGIPGRSLDRVDPNSIETITVLKDASAAIYGSQAANGVILITTKRGKVGKPQLAVNYSQGFNQPTRIPKLTNAAQYATALNELDSYSGIKPRYSEEDIQKYSDGSDPWGHPNTDWYDAVLKTWSKQSQANINISGGSEYMRYFVSLGAKNEDAFYKNSATKYKQYDFRTNLDIDVTKDKNIRIGMDVVGRLENSNFPGRGDVGTIINGLLRSKPNMPAYWPNGKLGPDIERGENPAAISTNITGFTNNKNYVFNTNLKLTVKIPWVQGLSLMGNAAYDKNIRFNKRFQKPWYLYSWDGISYDADKNPLLIRGKKGIDDPNLTQYMEDNFDYLLNGLIDYNKSIGVHHDISFLAGIETRKGGGDNFQAYRRYFVSEVLPQLDAGGSNALTNGGTAFENARLNYFGRINYSFKEKYLAEFVWRVDGSYIFPKDKRYGFFPGVSLGWRLSEEEFWKNNLSSISDNIKLRASYGITGNDRIDPWQYQSTYKFNAANYIFNVTNEARILNETRIPNPNVTWEVAKQMDFGIDATFLNNKLALTVDYFDYNRSNILWTRNASVPSSTGLTLPRENIGKVSNKGFDFDLAYNNSVSGFKYTVSVNGGYSKNKIKFWDESPGAPEYQQSTGKPMPSDPLNPSNDLYYQAIGIYKDQSAVDNSVHWPGARPGDVIFQDVNKDGVIDANDRIRSSKNDIPTFTGGINLAVQYKQFSLSVLFQGSAGAIRYLRLEPAGNFGNYLLSDFTDRWTPENPNGTKPRMFDRIEQYYRSQRSTYLLHNTDFIRLKNLELGYSFPDRLAGKIGMEKFRVFASGFNLLTFSKFKDFDPEDNNQGGMNYPLKKIVNVGLSLTL